MFFCIIRWSKKLDFFKFRFFLGTLYWYFLIGSIFSYYIIFNIWFLLHVASHRLYVFGTVLVWLVHDCPVMTWSCYYLLIHWWRPPDKWTKNYPEHIMRSHIRVLHCELHSLNDPPLKSSRMKLQRHVRGQNSGSRVCPVHLDYFQLADMCISRVFTFSR